MRFFSFEQRMICAGSSFQLIQWQLKTKHKKSKISYCTLCMLLIQTVINLIKYIFIKLTPIVSGTEIVPRVFIVKIMLSIKINYYVIIINVIIIYIKYFLFLVIK